MIQCAKCEPGKMEFFQQANEKVEAKCWNCGAVEEISVADFFADPKSRSSKSYLTKYPRIEPHTGAWVKSKDHEKETIRRLGYHEAPHGYDPRQKSALED